MSLLERTAHGVWNFVIGDDWRLAAGAGAAIGLVAVLVGLSLNAWWVLPVAVPGLMWWSVSGVARRSRRS